MGILLETINIMLKTYFGFGFLNESTITENLY